MTGLGSVGVRGCRCLCHSDWDSRLWELRAALEDGSGILRRVKGCSAPGQRTKPPRYNFLSFGLYQLPTAA